MCTLFPPDIILERNEKVWWLLRERTTRRIKRKTDTEATTNSVRVNGQNDLFSTIPQQRLARFYSGNPPPRPFLAVIVLVSYTDDAYLVVVLVGGR